MQFGFEKCAMLIMRNRKGQIKDGIEQSDQERIRILGEKDNYKYSKILKADITKQAEMKEKI